MYNHSNKGGWSKAHCMSNRAVAAYRAGLKPLSKIKASDLKAAGLDITLGFAKYLAREGEWARSEWHHSGLFEYEVNFYDTKDLAERIEELKAEDFEYEDEMERDQSIKLSRFDVLIEYYQSDCNKKRFGKSRNVEGFMGEWSGSRKMRVSAFKGLLGPDGWIRQIEVWHNGGWHKRPGRKNSFGKWVTLTWHDSNTLTVYQLEGAEQPPGFINHYQFSDY